MARLEWLNTADRTFETGLDRGVLYPKGTPPDGAVNNQNLQPIPRPGATGNYNYSTDGWGGQPTYTSFTAGGPPGNSGWYLRGTAVSTFTPTSTSVLMLQQRYNNGSIAVTPGQTVTMSIYVRCSIAQTVLCLAVGLDSNGNGTNSAAGPNVTLVPNTWTRISSTFTPDGSTTVARLDIRAGTSGRIAWHAGDTLDIADCMIENGSVLHPYFDGDTNQSGLYYYEWLQGVNSSVSQQVEVTTLAVPWNGLISVDENGGEDIATYYIDGRPYLNVPKPKEFSATIKAYTYPEEFNAMLGVVEVSDGLFLDSQMSDSFDLCYRTLIGNATEGTAYAYKIHLIYGATVAPSSVSYASLADQVNPIEFSWDIKTVPQAVTGYRSTAHIIIDSRHMDPARLSTIEDGLYGSESNVASMPTLQSLFDTVIYGNTITIIDNGDGTWTAIGSDENIFMIGDGVFEIDNSNAVDNGDGTFTISTS